MIHDNPNETGNVILVEFKSSLIDFFDDLIQQFSEDDDLIRMRIYIKDQVDIQNIMNIFNYNIHKEDQNIRKLIKEKNNKVFVDHNLFDFCDDDKIKVNFKKIWRSPDLVHSNREIIWKWVRTFVYLVDKYNKGK